MTSEARYPIRAASRITGVPVETLRAWERRYRLVAPARDSRGRSYNEAELRKLRLLRQLVERGHSIGQVASLPEEQLLALLQEPPQPVPVNAGFPPEELGPLLAALEAYEAVALEAELGRRASLLPTREFVWRVALPLMREVGTRWQDGRFTVAQEHLATAALMGVLGGLRRLQGGAPGRVRVLFAAPAGERHEFGLLAGAMLSAGRGLSVVYLGSDLPAEDIATAARRTGARVVVVSATGSASADAVLEQVARLSRQVVPGAELWTGGAQTPAYALRLESAGARYIGSIEHLDESLERLASSLVA